MFQKFYPDLYVSSTYEIDFVPVGRGPDTGD